jgi:hypothetical protein
MCRVVDLARHLHDEIRVFLRDGIHIAAQSQDLAVHGVARMGIGRSLVGLPQQAGVHLVPGGMVSSKEGLFHLLEFEVHVGRGGTVAPLSPAIVAILPLQAEPVPRLHAAGNNQVAERRHVGGPAVSRLAAVFRRIPEIVEMDAVEPGSRAFRDDAIAVLRLRAPLVVIPYPVIRGELMRRVVKLESLAQVLRDGDPAIQGVAPEHADIHGEILHFLAREEDELDGFRIGGDGKGGALCFRTLAARRSHTASSPRAAPSSHPAPGRWPSYSRAGQTGHARRRSVPGNSARTVAASGVCLSSSTVRAGSNRWASSCITWRWKRRYGGGHC